MNKRDVVLPVGRNRLFLKAPHQPAQICTADLPCFFFFKKKESTQFYKL